ncbi:MAG: hypothetical protein RH862_05235 [Leptospiraceae bacterium]
MKFPFSVNAEFFRLPVGLLVVLTAYLIYQQAEFGGTMDTYLHLPIASTLVDSGTMNIDIWRNHKFMDPLFEMQFWMIQRDGLTYSYFPFGSSLMAVPYALYIGPVLIQTPGFDHRNAQQNFASLLAAWSLLFIYLTLLRVSGRILISASGTVAVAFGTTIYSTAAVAIWTHTTGLLCLSFGLYCLTTTAYSRHNNRTWHLLLWLPAGILAGIACIIRPTNIVFLSSMLLYCTLTRQWKALGLAVLGGTPAILCGLLLSKLTFGTYLPPYIGEQGLTGLIPEALLAYLISPGRGLFIYMPFSILALFAMPQILRGIRAATVLRFPRRNLILLLCAGNTTIGYLIFCSWSGWWGGWSYGPRFWTEAVPFLAVLSTAGYMQAESTFSRSQPGFRPALRLILFFLFCWSLFVHSVGANSRKAMIWNQIPPHLGISSDRVWDWRDPQFFAF